MVFGDKFGSIEDNHWLDFVLNEKLQFLDAITNECFKAFDSLFLSSDISIE